MKYIHNDSLLTHGAGALHSLVIGKSRFSGKRIRLHRGGYGNVKRPFGCFSWYPYIVYYRHTALHVNWFNCGISFIFN